MSKPHTPGPWRYQERSDAYTHIVRAGENRFLCQLAQDTSGEAEANARMIAAAPELLAALRTCAEALAFARDRLGMCGEGDGQDRKADAPDDIGSLPALIDARAAIAKAEGRA